MGRTARALARTAHRARSQGAFEIAAHVLTRIKRAAGSRMQARLEHRDVPACPEAWYRPGFDPLPGDAPDHARGPGALASAPGPA